MAAARGRNRDEIHCKTSFNEDLPGFFDHKKAQKENARMSLQNQQEIEKDETIDHLIGLRHYKSSSDDALIYQTWLKGLYYGNEWFGAMTAKRFNTEYRMVLNYLIPRSKIKCACLIDDPDVILGYSVIEGSKLHWIFVKSSWRRLGIAKRLVPSDIDCVTHLTQIGKRLKPNNWEFNPFNI